MGPPHDFYGCDSIRVVASPGPPIDVCFKGLKQLSELLPPGDEAPRHASLGGAPFSYTGVRGSQVGHPTLGGPPGRHESADLTRSLLSPLQQQMLGRSAAAVNTTIAAAAATGGGGDNGGVSGGTGANQGPPTPPTRKSVCITKSHHRVVSVCSLALRGQLNSVVREPKKAKVLISLVPRAVRLSNNELTDAQDLPFHLSFLMSSPTENLRWLDLSFNRLEAVPPSLEELFNLRNLYLHYNAIENPAEVLSLQNNQNLQFLTLMGNPLEQHLIGSYRTAVAAALPGLKSLDFTPFSGDEREVACRANPAKLLRSRPKPKQRDQHGQQLPSKAAATSSQAYTNRPGSGGS
ncbi:hypothetical protein ACSSS7_006146 [Eimeria intestinalis]